MQRFFFTTNILNWSDKREKGERKIIASSKWIYMTIKTHQKYIFVQILNESTWLHLRKIDKNKKKRRRRSYAITQFMCRCVAGDGLAAPFKSSFNKSPIINFGFDSLMMSKEDEAGHFLSSLGVRNFFFLCSSCLTHFHNECNYKINKSELFISIVNNNLSYLWHFSNDFHILLI